MTDIEIARNTKLDNITEISKELNIDDESLELYGKYKAKISNDVYKKMKDKQDGKLILVTAINPTPMGEGKTTVSIAIGDGFSKIGKAHLGISVFILVPLPAASIIALIILFHFPLY